MGSFEAGTSFANPIVNRDDAGSYIASIFVPSETHKPGTIGSLIYQFVPNATGPATSIQAPDFSHARASASALVKFLVGHAWLSNPAGLLI